MWFYLLKSVDGLVEEGAILRVWYALLGILNISIVGNGIIIWISWALPDSNAHCLFIYTSGVIMYSSKGFTAVDLSFLVACNAQKVYLLSRLMI